MAKKTDITKEEFDTEESKRTGSSFLDYLRFGESYTSLILGIIVVIISTALLLSFVHNRNGGESTTPNNEKTKNIVQISEQQIKDMVNTPTVPLTQVKTTPVLTRKMAAPTTKPTAKPTVKPTAAPTKAEPTEKVVAKPTNKPAEQPKVETKNPANGEYVVKKGDTLWSIAEAQYKNGYKWVDIARANKLSNPSMINAGNKLILPKLTAQAPVKDSQKGVSTSDEQNNSTTMKHKISGDSYTVVKGDNLWNIAVDAYGDGYQWVNIAKANNLKNPSLIHSGNKLKIPRGK